MEDDKAESFWKGEKNTSSTKRENQKRKHAAAPTKQKINLEGTKIRNGLAQLILTVIELLRELMEKQAIRRIEAGSLQEEEVERLGNTFIALKQELNKLKEYFKLKDEDLNFSLGPILAREDDAKPGQVSAIEILDRLLGKGVVVRGDIVISVAEVDLLSLNLGLLLASVDKAKELYGSAAGTAELQEEVRILREENARLKQKKI